MSFKEWMTEVDEILVDSCGVGSDDLPDWNYRDNFDADVSPEDAAEEILEDNGFFI